MLSRDVVLLLSALGLATAEVRAQDTTAVVTGRVWDPSGVAIQAASVSLGRGRPFARTDSGGRFRFAGLAPGRYIVTARRVGYHSASIDIELHRGETRDISLRLAVLPVPLDTMVSEGQATSENLRRAGFTRRQRLGFGDFLTRDDIQRLAAFDLWDVLRRTPFLTVIDRRGEHLLLMQNGACRPRVYVDGALMPLLDGIPVDVIDGIEVYRRAVDVPVEFSGAGRACGAVLVWTR